MAYLLREDVIEVNQVSEALENEHLPIVKKLLGTSDGKRFEKLVLNKYLEGHKPQNWPEQELSPDTQEAQEAVRLDERRLLHAAVVWRNLSPEERHALLKATEAIYGLGEAEELEQLLLMRLR
jgi:hypothetical protein